MYGRPSDERNVNSHHPLVACIVSLLACAPAVAAPPRGCDAAWAAEAKPHLVALDATSAAFKMGTLVIARAKTGEAPRLLQAMQPENTVAATLAPLGASRWRVRGPIEVDDECTLNIDAQVVLEKTDAPTARAAQALVLLGQARAASDDAQPERASDLARQALAELELVSEQPVAAATITAFAIERLIEQRQLGRALQLAQEMRPKVQGRLDPAQPAFLRFELATVRLTAWPEALAERRRLQGLLDATFGPYSLPAMENRVRYANNLLVLNRAEASLKEFDAVEAILRDDPRPAPALRMLLARSHANAL